MPLPAWASSAVYMYIQSVVFQYESLSSEFDRLPADMQWAKRKADLLALCLKILSKICQDERHELLKKSDKDSKDVLQLYKDISVNTTSESRHEQFPFPSLDLSSCCFNLSCR
jgi:hypothetical protein